MSFLSALNIGFDFDAEALDTVSLDQVTAVLGLPTRDSTETLATTAPLDLVDIFSPGLSQQVTSAIALLETATGVLTLDSGALSGTVTTAEGTETVALDGAPFFDTLLTEVETLTAVTTLENGLFSGDLPPAAGTRLSARVNAGSLLDTTLSPLLPASEVTLPFENGQFAVDLATALGAVTGGVDFAGGDLNIDLATPLGDLTLDYVFPTDTAIPFDIDAPIGDLPGSLDLAAGQVTVPLLAGGISFGVLSVSLASLSGEVALADGIASLSVDVPDLGILGIPSTVTTDIDLGPLASEIVEGFITETTGSLAIDDGLLTASLTSPLGSWDTTTSLVELSTDAVDFLTATTGILTLNQGMVSTTLETPLGETSISTTLTDIRDVLTSPLLG